MNCGGKSTRGGAAFGRARLLPSLFGGRGEAPRERRPTCSRRPAGFWRVSRLVAIGALSVLFARFAVADDVITNVMSPIVSYQFPDDFNSQALTNGGISSPIVSYQYFEWPGDSILQLLSSPPVSYYYQIGSEGAPILLHGRLTDASGAALPDATVSAMVGLTPAAQATTDASGAYQFPSLGAGVYVLTASAAGHQGSLRVLTLGAATAQQDFQLAVLPAAPSVRQTTRQPPASFTQPPVGPMGSTLRVFDGAQFAAITPANAPSPNLMTIVLTHGWIPEYLGVELAKGVEGWPTEMAAELRTNGMTPAVANILAWDWRYAAEGPYAMDENAPGQGVALGLALQAVLGTGYSKPIHFLGHSLGALVNAAAANYLHGDHPADTQQPVSATPWLASPMHMTLFDQAEASWAVFGPLEWVFDGLTVQLANLGVPLQVPSGTSQGWKPSMPVHSTWADNYVSIFGFHQTNAVNVYLQKTPGYANPTAAHGYPMDWYGQSIANPTGSLLGFQRSFEYDEWAGLPPSAFPPSTADFPLGSNYHQKPSASEQLVLEPLGSESSAPSFGIGAAAVVQGAIGTIQAVGNVGADIADGAQQAGQWVSQGFDYVGSVAAQGAQTLVGLWNSASLRLTFHTLPPSPLKDGSGGPPMAWVPLMIPTNAAAMAFDFTVAGDPVDDVIVCGLGTNNLFSLQAKFVPTNGVSASRLIDVTAWAGATNELFFGLMGGTSTNATVQIENIRFYSLQPPQLQIANAADGTVRLTWPATAGGYGVETATSLAPADWTTLTNAPTLTADRYTLTSGVGDAARFFRLRPR